MKGADALLLTHNRPLSYLSLEIWIQIIREERGVVKFQFPSLLAEIISICQILNKRGVRGELLALLLLRLGWPK